MQARYEFVEKLREEVKDKLRELTQDQGMYKELIEKLILQVFLNKFRQCSEWWREMSQLRWKSSTLMWPNQFSPAAANSSQKSWKKKLARIWIPTWHFQSLSLRILTRKLLEEFSCVQVTESLSVITLLIREWDWSLSSFYLKSGPVCSPKSKRKKRPLWFELRSNQ